MWEETGEELQLLRPKPDVIRISQSLTSKYASLYFSKEDETKQFEKARDHVARYHCPQICQAKRMFHYVIVILLFELYFLIL